MKELAFRLKNGDDFRKSIEIACNQYNTCVILSAVGSLKEVKIRLAKAKNYYEKIDDYEIVSITGTVSNGKSHIHVSLSNEKGDVIGGHLEYGCKINTTCELIIGILQEYESIRKFDDNTGFDEIEFNKIVEG